MIACAAEIAFGLASSMITDNRHTKQVKWLFNIKPFGNDIYDNAHFVDIPIGKHASNMLRHAHCVHTGFAKIKFGGSFFNRTLFESCHNVVFPWHISKPVDSNSRVMTISLENKAMVSENRICFFCTSCLVPLVNNCIVSHKGSSNGQRSLRAAIFARLEIAKKDTIEFGQHLPFC
ncbi:hypothetical protein BD408DRAFT_416895 [Parasitella parasitica]|nr:hypothetical protein BD408DRAFT_416895 [Parasitella parasitica]